MRHCKNETVNVYEAQGANLGDLLREAADLVENHDGYAVVNTAYDIESENILTVYLHS